MENKTKKALVISGAIVGIIFSVFMLLVGMFMFMCATYVSYDLVVDILTQEGVLSEYTTEDINLIVNVTKSLFNTTGAYLVFMNLITLAFSIVVNVTMNKSNYKNGFIITLLVFSILTFNLITAVLLIVALCIRSKVNIDEIVQEIENSSTNDAGNSNND